MQPYRKADISEEYVPPKQQEKKKKVKDSQQKIVKVMQNDSNQDCNEKDTSRAEDQGGKKKSKYISLYSSEGMAKDVIFLPGRHHCDCQAAKHGLINNCMHCGRIVCKQEGSGPCIFCSNLVCTNEEQEIIAQNSTKSAKLLSKLIGNTARKVEDNEKLLPKQQLKMTSGLEKAIMHKNKLLDYDKTCEKRTRVIDDESDYFSLNSNAWLTQKQREALMKRDEELQASKQKARHSHKITIDFAGRRVLEDDVGSVNEFDDPIVKKILQGLEEDQFSDIPTVNEDIFNSNTDFQRPVFQDLAVSGRRVPSHDSAGMDSRSRVMRIQDRELQEMSDEGYCLSMHQPWASLLISGIKKHEGRTWYTAHRGRLWIAAAGKQPSQQEIKEAENLHRLLSGDEYIQFPSQYPTGCLLGCVDVMHCLPQEEYRDKFPDGESASPFVFICENPQELIVKFPTKGQHKIYKLDSRIHQAAKKTLKKNSEERRKIR